MSQDHYPRHEGRALTRFTDWRVEDERKLAAILRETGLPARPARLSLELASSEDLRGIPVIGRGVSGGVRFDDRELGRAQDDPFAAACRMDWLD